MSELVLPMVVLLASLALTYFFCLRPMRHGRCVMGSPSAEQDRQARNDSAELARLREELAALQAADSDSRGETS